MFTDFQVFLEITWIYQIWSNRQRKPNSPQINPPFHQIIIEICKWPYKRALKAVPSTSALPKIGGREKRILGLWFKETVYHAKIVLDWEQGTP